MNVETVSEAFLNEVRKRCEAATRGPWISYVEGRDHTSGEDFIMRGTEGAWEEDLYLTGATAEDQDFIAHARQDVPLLINEVERLRSLLKDLEQNQVAQ